MRDFFLKMSRTRANGCWGEDSDLEAERLRPALRGRPKAGLSVIFGFSEIPPIVTIHEEIKPQSNAAKRILNN